MISEFINTLYWREVSLLGLMALPIIFVAFNRFQHHWQWQKIADNALHPWLKTPQKQTKQTASILFLSLSWLLFVIALAGPRSVDWLPPDQQAEPETLIIVFDFSASMNAKDVYPSRKAQAIQWLQHSIINKPSHLKMGIVLFAGHAFTLLPPTLDKHLIEHFIKQLNNITLPTLGNDLSAALLLAQQQFKQNDKKQWLIVLSDGDLSKAEQKRAQLTLQSNFKEQNVTLLGFGKNSAVNIPKSNGGFIEFNGRPVQSRLHSDWFKEVSAFPHVSYHHYHKIKQQTLSETLQLKPPRLNKTAQQQVIWHELFIYPLALALCFFIISFWRANLNKGSLKPPMQFMFFLCAITLFLSHSPVTLADTQSTLLKANTLLDEKKFKRAQVLFSQIDSPTAAFGEGIACYRLADFNCATRAFSTAAWQSKTDAFRANAVFNLANSYFFLGEYEQASVLFLDAKNLGFDPKLAQRNLEFSNVMQRSVLQRIKDIKEIFRRAKWRAARLGNIAPTLNTIISNQNNLALPSKKNTQHYLIRQASTLKVQQLLGGHNNGNHTATQWIKTEHMVHQSTARLLTRLLEMELAIPAALKEPQTIKGKRQW